MSLFLETERLTLRSFIKTDVDDLAAMNADARVMEFFPATMSRDESAAFLQRIMAHEAAHGFSLLALHLKESGVFCGFAGLLKADFDAPFLPAVEIGWRLAHAAWGQGLGPEAARACLALGFTELQLQEIISFTTVKNFRSIRVMEKIGMMRDAAHDFDHPNVPPGDALRPHVLYRLRRDAWTAWQS
jgi:RimJ/RimL family protein N-acetyltransferase